MDYQLNDIVEMKKQHPFKKSCRTCRVVFMKFHKYSFFLGRLRA